MELDEVITVTFDNFINFLKLFKNIPEADISLIEQGLAFKKVAEGDVLFF